jgi:hypothetical protein
MGYAGLGKVRQEFVDAIKLEFEGCSIYGTMINGNGQLDGQRCMERYFVLCLYIQMNIDK